MRIKQAVRMTLHQYNLKWGINHISQPFLQGYEVVLEDESVHWCPEGLYEKNLKPNYEKTKSPRPVITLA